MGLAEDPTYRSHVSFLLTGIAVFCLLFLPILMRTTVPTAAAGHMSEDMQTLMKVLSQVGVYVGAVITFLLAFALFRYFAKEPRTLKAYFKLYCLAFGFVMPLYAVYEFAARGLLGGTGMSSFNETAHPVQWSEPSTLISAALGARPVELFHRHSPALLAHVAVAGGRALRRRGDCLLSAELLAHVRRRLLDDQDADRGRPRQGLMRPILSRASAGNRRQVGLDQPWRCPAAGVRVGPKQRLELGARDRAKAHLGERRRQVFAVVDDVAPFRSR